MIYTFELRQPTVSDDNPLGWYAARGAERLNLPDHVLVDQMDELESKRAFKFQGVSKSHNLLTLAPEGHTRRQCEYASMRACHRTYRSLDHLAKHDMLAVEPRRLGRGDEKLAPICIWTCICHGKTENFMLDIKVLIRECPSVNALATRAISPREITALKHKLRDHSVETAPLVPETCLAGAKLLEILNSFRHRIAIPIARTSQTHKKPELESERANKTQSQPRNTHSPNTILPASSPSTDTSKYTFCVMVKSGSASAAGLVATPSAAVAKAATPVDSARRVSWCCSEESDTD